MSRGRRVGEGLLDRDDGWEEGGIDGLMWMWYWGGLDGELEVLPKPSSLRVEDSGASRRGEMFTIYYCQFVNYWPDFRVRLHFFVNSSRMNSFYNSLPSEGFSPFQFFSKEKLGPIII